MTQTSQELLTRFETDLRHKQSLNPRQKILVACSGGPDSVALFHLMRSLVPKYHWRLSLIHFNHGLRPGAAKVDERFVRILARKYRIPFFCGAGDVKRAAREGKTSIEECARKMRYDFFLKISREKKISMIVLAHTQDDQAETVLMRVLQGTGLRGLQGIREKVRMGAMTVVRPLLSFSKKQLQAYLALEKIRFRLDRSNASSRFVRNRIRLNLLPALRRDFNPRVVEALSRIPVIVAAENDLISELEAKVWGKAFKKASRGEIELRRIPFLKAHPALQFRLIERALKKLDPLSGLSFEGWELLRQGFSRPRWRCSLPRDIDFALTSKRVILYKK